MEVHPSRAGLVPDASRPQAADYHATASRGRSRSRSPPPHLQHQHQHERQRSRSPPPHQQSRGERRPSPSYDAYQGRRDEYRVGPPGGGGGGGGYEGRRRTPERELGDGYGYGNRGGGQGRTVDGQGGYQRQQRGYGRAQQGQGGGADWFESRRKERDASSVSIWPPSPRGPARDTSPSSKDRKDRKSSSSKHKSSSSSRRRRHDSVSSDSSDSEDDRRRSSKHKSSSSSRHKSSSSRHKSSSSSRHKSSSRRDVSDDEGERKKRRRSESESREARPKTVQEEPEEEEDDDEDAWVEKEVQREDLEGEEEVGPLPLMAPGRQGKNAYGGALLRGEGAAMAAYLENDERIPRRGEIGMESDTIERFEQAGYVMSGSRHRRMNAVRVRKENQVISAEEKRGILKLQAEEKAKRENQIVASFREMVDQKLGGQGASQSRG
ncbi:ras-induced vulval development antagonist-domain-containing protein [Leucosporidium creatinivorum]|uniref:Ras-induced vulval development antagonist-domain-containing protein n=1 Tax=Leucosporidium creatinivorum TaxID=106004 RepID=A0A1Y2E8V5_9BASI|nr:ras-induced vulval development antagonist-domain-containing protein [Leucosporidium creatinivorum]